jgi:PAS domain S-box-containing protein
MDETRGTWAATIRGDATVARWLALTAMALTIPGVIGWTFGISWLVQPLETFAPARVWGTLMIPAGAGGLLALLGGRLRLARWMALLCGAAALVGPLAALAGTALPFDRLAHTRVGLSHSPETLGIPLSIGVFFLTYASALLLLTQRQVSERTRLLVGGLSASLVAMAGVLFVAQLAGLLNQVTFAPVRSPVHSLLAALVLGIALLRTLALREAFTLAPPRWAPVLVGVSSALVVLVVWQSLRARETEQLRARAQITADAIERATRRQMETVVVAAERVASYIEAHTGETATLWRVVMPRLVAETDGLAHLALIGADGRLLHDAPSPVSMEAATQQLELQWRARRSSQASADSADVSLSPFSSAVTGVPWRVALWEPLQQGEHAGGAVVALVDEVALVKDQVDEASREFAVRLVLRDSMLLESGDVLGEPVSRTEVALGAMGYRLDLYQRPGAVRNTLPDVVLGLGLVVAVLLVLTLWLQRRIWEQASEEGLVRMQRAIERATDGVWELDVQQGRTHRSPSLLRYLGVDPLVLEGGFAAWSALIHPDDVSRVLSALEAHLHGEAEAFECEYRLRAGDGSWHTLVDRGRVVERTADGQSVRLLGISADVTDRMRAEAAREESERRFRAMFDTAYQLQLLLDLDGTMLEANRAAGDLAELPPDALQGMAFWQAPWWGGDPTTAERVQERFARARDGETLRFEIELTAGRERPLTVDFSLKPIVDREGRVAQVLAEGRDLTIRKRAEQSLREISTLTTMGQLAARVAHEINNPLAGIQNAFLLIRGAIPADHPHYRFVGAIEREIARIAAVTRQLYETYRPDQLMATQASVILAVSDAVSFLEQVNRGRQVRIVTDVSRAPSVVPVPDALLRQTLYNLVQNALDVSPPNGTITVEAVQEGGECVLRVRDEGPGVPAAIRERIFDPFFSTKDRSMKTGGMGIGLTLVRQSVLAVGGRIEVRDPPAGGTEFEVRLPMTPLDTGVLQ